MVGRNLTNSENSTHSIRAILLVIAILCISFTLRGPITAVGSVAGLIRESLEASNGLLGFVTTLPLLAFALCSPFLFRISDRFGIGRVMFCGLCLSFCGCLLRSLAGVPGLLLGTVFLGMGICVGNVLIPSVIKLKFPEKIGILTSMYITGQGVFASLGAGISYPLAVKEGVGWKMSLLIWCIFIFAAFVTWLPHVKLKDPSVLSVDKESRLDSSTGNIKKLNLLHSRLAIAITVFMGAQSLCFYSITAWLPSILASHSVAPEFAGYMALWFQIANIPASFLVPLLAASKRVNQKWVIMIACGCYFIGLIGMLFYVSTVVTVVLLFFTALGSGATFAWITAIIGVKAKNAQQAAKLMGMSQSLGYLMAALGPTLCGFFYDVSGGWYWSVGLLIVVIMIMFGAGMVIVKKQEL